MTRDTRLDGDPASIEAGATWIRSTVAASTSALADVAAQVRGESGAAWDSTAGAAYVAELGVLARAADDTSAVAERVAGDVEVLAGRLRAAQGLMELARSAARAGGLRVRGTLIDPPEAGVAGQPFLPVEDAAERAWQRAMMLADEAEADWDAAVEAVRPAAAKVEALHTLLLTVFVGLSELPAHVGVRAWERSGLRAWEHSKTHWGRLLGGLIDEGGHLRVGPADLDLAVDRLRAAERGVEAAKGRSRLGASAATPTVRAGFGALNTLVVAYSTYDDLQHGESVGQAVASNGGGLLGSIAAGAGAGALGTSWAGPPGTVVGGILGGLAGGIGTSWVIDRAYDSQDRRKERPVTQGDVDDLLAPEPFEGTINTPAMADAR